MTASAWGASVVPKNLRNTTVKLQTVVVFLLCFVSPCAAFVILARQQAAAPERVGAGLVALIGLVLLAGGTLLRRRFEPGRPAARHNSETRYHSSETRYREAGAVETSETSRQRLLHSEP